MARINMGLENYAKPPYVLRSISESQIYENGNATGKTDGYNVECVAFGSNFETLRVKVKSIDDILEKVDNETLAANNNSRAYMIVTFQNAMCSPYASSGGGVKFSCRAESAGAVKAEAK